MKIFIHLLQSIFSWVILTLLALDLFDEVTHWSDPIPETHEGETQEETQGSSKLCHQRLYWVQQLLRFHQQVRRGVPYVKDLGRSLL